MTFDYTMRSVFSENRKHFAWDDEMAYHRKYGERKHFAWGNNYLPKFFTGDTAFNFGRIKLHISHIPKSFDENSQSTIETLEDNPIIKLGKFLGEYSRYVPNLDQRCHDLYEEWYGHSNDECECCGIQINALTAAKYRSSITGKISRSSLCELCGESVFQSKYAIPEKFKRIL